MLNPEKWPKPDKNLLLDYLKFNSYCSKKYKILYVSTPKVACTSLKWWFAEMEGLTKTLLTMTKYSSEVDPYLAIHDCFHKVAPLVTGLDFDKLYEPITSDSYIRFAIVRNPFKRIFSAWQSKIFFREPLQMKSYSEYKHYNKPLVNSKNIAESFENFLENILQHKNSTNLFENFHWTPQANLLRPDLISYTNISQIEHVEQIAKILSERIGAGFINPFVDKRWSMNSSLIPYQPDLITERSANLIRNLYAEDFDTFEYSNKLPNAKKIFSSEKYEVAINATYIIRARHLRIEELNEFKQTLTDRDKQLNEFKQTLTDRDKQLNEFKQTLTDRDKQLNEFKQTLTDRDKQLNEFKQTLTDRDKQLNEFKQTLTDRDKQLNEFKQTLTDRDKQLNEFKQTLTDRDKQLNEFKQTLTDRDKQLNEFKQTLTDRDKQLNEFKQTLTDRDKQLNEFKQTLTDRDKQLNEFKQTLTDRGNQIKELNEAMNQILRSKSWLLTKPLRFIVSKLRRIKY